MEHLERPTQPLKFVSVILDVSIDKLLDYSVPEELADKVKRGMRVEVPVRGHLRPGYIFEVKSSSTFPRLHPISQVLSDEEHVTDDLFDLSLWMAKYYCAPLRLVFKIILPASVRRLVQPKQQLFVMRAKTRDELAEHCTTIRTKHPAQAVVLDEMLQVKKGILLTELLEKTGGTRSPVDTLAKQGFLVVDIVRIDRSPLVNEEYFKTKPKPLNEGQAEALAKICNSLDHNIFETHLLFGVTGSGKTEVYLQAIDKALKQGKGAIMLVPEISLTAQTIERFRSRFEGQIAVLHHRLSPGERLDEWDRIRRGDAKIVIGARSAVFSPVQNLGLLIVDEEHESSYKQTDEAPCYHARDVAVMRGKLSAATVILGSATPSLESFHNATKAKYILSPLRIRADSAAIPSFTIVNMKQEYERAKTYTSFSEALLKGIKKRVESGEQTILFLNRRGYHTTLLCKGCGTAVKCHHCDTALTFHLGENALSCHLCGFTLSPPPRICQKCKAPDPLKFKGVGTEQIEKALHAVFPEIRTLRVDADTTRHKGSHQKLLRDFGTGKADVLIGTQMIAKGLHFPQVTLVGVLNSDASLNIPDFRASETVFQLITQVAGRAGRGKIQGEVIVQTLLPDNPTIQLAAAQEYEKFFAEELNSREMFRYPPFSQMVKLAVSATDARKALEYASRLRRALQQQLADAFELHPVVPAGHAKVKDRFRYQFLVRGPSIAPINRAIEVGREEVPQPHDVRLLIDVNPLSTYF